MKKIYFLRLWLIAAMLGIAYSASANYSSPYVDGIFYNLNETERTAEVTYYSSYISENEKAYVRAISIPSVFVYKANKYTVTTIGESAFYGCSRLTSVTIPESVTEIVDGVFYECSGLTSVIIPNSLLSR